MVAEGPAKKLSVYVDETEKAGGKPVYELLMELFHSHRIAGVSVFRGVAGYGSGMIVHTAKFLELSTTLPLKIEVIDSGEAIAKILPEISSIMRKGLVEVSDCHVVLSRGRDHMEK